MLANRCNYRKRKLSFRMSCAICDFDRNVQLTFEANRVIPTIHLC